jgi:outer membrane protein TolC
LPGAVELSLVQNPNVTAAMFGIDVNFLQVKVAEGALLPTVTLQAAVQQSYEQTLLVYRSFGASAIYAVLNSAGRLSPQVLSLRTTVYDPSVHYQQVRDS